MRQGITTCVVEWSCSHPGGQEAKGREERVEENATLQVQILSDLPPPTIPPPEVSTAFEQLVKL